MGPAVIAAFRCDAGVIASRSLEEVCLIDTSVAIVRTLRVGHVLRYPESAGGILRSCESAMPSDSGGETNQSEDDCCDVPS